MAQNLIQASIFELLGLTNLPHERQVALLDKLTDLVQKRVMLRVVDALPEEDKKKAEKIFSSGTDQEKTEFLRSRVDFPRLVEEEVVAVKQELLDDVGKLEL